MSRQRDQDDEALAGLDACEQMLNTFAQQAKSYWRMWGPAGEPMISGIDAWTEMQRAQLKWLRQRVEDRP